MMNSLFLLLLWANQAYSWTTTSTAAIRANAWRPSSLSIVRTKNEGSSSTRLNFFDKMFEEEGILGKGITVGKVQIALNSPNRGPDSIFGILEREAKDDKSLAELTNAICLALLRKKDDWIGAAGTGEWFSQNDGGKAESKFNDYANKEAFKFEKVRIEYGWVVLHYSITPMLSSTMHFY